MQAKTHLDKLELAVAGVNSVLILAGVGLELAAVDGEGEEGEGAVSILVVFAVLPLYYALRAAGGDSLKNA